MKTTKAYSLILLVSIITIASCTMQKRHYAKGYHVEWKNGIRGRNPQEVAMTNHGKKADRNSVVSNTVTKKVVPAIASAVIPSDLKEKNIVSKEKHEIISNSKHNKEHDIAQVHSEFNTKKGNLNTINYRSLIPTDSGNQEVAGEAIASVIFGFLGVFFGITSIIAIVCGIEALIKIKEDKEHYKGKEAAVFGIILGVVLGVIWCWIYYMMTHLSF